MNKQHTLFDDELAFLLELADLATDPIIEIGCLRGATTAQLAKVCQRNGRNKVIAIDPWDGRQDGSDESIYQEFIANIEPVKDFVTVIRSSSRDAVVESAGLVLVDGDHTYTGCINDLRKYYPILSVGGCMVVHDYYSMYWPGIKKAVDGFVAKAGCTLMLHNYVPSEKEVIDHDCSGAGLAVFRKI